MVGLECRKGTELPNKVDDAKMVDNEESNKSRSDDEQLF